MNELVIVAGLTPNEEPSFKKEINLKIRQGTELRFFSVTKENPKYLFEKIDAFLVAIVNIILAEKPKILRLIFIPYTNHTALVDCFFPFADIQSVIQGVTYNNHYLQYMPYENCLKKIISTIQGGLVQRALPSKKHFSLLPVGNFKLERNEFNLLLKKRYVSSEVTDEDVVNFIKLNEENSCYEDARGLIFPVSKTLEGSLGFDKTKMTAKYFLSSMYRLGRLWGQGLHHDVTCATKKTLKGIDLLCALNGTVRGKNATHANIYLNDYIRLQYKK